MNKSEAFVATTKSQQKAVYKYIKGNYDRLNILIPKGYKQIVEAHAKARGESINGFVNSLLRKELGVSESEWKQDSKPD